jgi:hypothetical protein
MRCRQAAVLAVLCLLTMPRAAGAQEPAAPPNPPAAAPNAAGAQARIVWEVKNRFRLFRHESDFLRHVAAEGDQGVLGAERRLARGSNGHGWARLMVNGRCVDAAGTVLRSCERDGVQESYLAPVDHRIGASLAGAPADAQCAWKFEHIDQPPQIFSLPCRQEVTLRIRYDTPTFASVEATAADGTVTRARAELLVRDLLIAGMGDSTASGEGNPDRPIVLDDSGFCFRRVVGTGGNEYYRPGRAGYRGNRTCETTNRDNSAGRDWMRRGARWMSAACHRSLYGYQVRTALAVAVENPHVAVTFVPLACTGAEIENGLFESQRARETTCGARPGARACPTTVPPQLAQAKAALDGARRIQKGRAFDTILLTVGANDIYFSELVGNVLLARSPERALLESSGAIASIEDAQTVLKRQLPAEFVRLRAALKPLVGGILERVVFVSYADPALHDGGKPCGGGRAGVDVHPAFDVNGDLLRQSVEFVEREFLPRLKSLALCRDGVMCKDEGDRMTFVDSHQDAFRDHGFCARGDSDPAFDRACFSEKGTSFRESLREAVQQPLACSPTVREFRAYASRARWIRTPNDSYFAAMTYPDGLPRTTQPADLHDALWGVLSAVYGGAIHPTAEGHAVMADAALEAARHLLNLSPPEEAEPAVESRPLPPIDPPSPN